MSEGETSRMIRHLDGDARNIVQRLRRLQEVGTALTGEGDLERLLARILKEGRALLQAEAGSVFLREDDVSISPRATGKDEIHQVRPRLVLKVAQNDAIRFPFQEMRLPFDTKTVAGYVATSGDVVNVPDVYALDKGSSFSYSTTFDHISGYRCRSMLVVPMRKQDGEIVGVLQLINKKSGREGGGFDDVDVEYLLALASQAAVCVEKNRLYADIEGMFEALVNSFSLAIEMRDAATHGHCTRVAQYAVAIAKAVNTAPAENFGGVRFGEPELRELRYAALLHDVGKIAVPEAILGKKNKLTDDQLRVIEYRFAYWKERKPEDGPRLDEILAWIRKVNIPRGMSGEDLAFLEEARGEKFVDIDGAVKALLTDFEVKNLEVLRGNLTPEERGRIERHIVDTWELLKPIPWPKGLRWVPNIASCHHEKIDGSGYPWGLRGDEIPLGGRILALVDIFEALTAKDRSYKPAFPVDRALEILRQEVEANHIDSGLFRLFREREIYKMFVDQTGYVTMKESEKDESEK